MKHIIITDIKGRSESPKRLERAMDSMKGAATLKYYDVSQPWPLRGFTRMCNEAMSSAAPGEVVCIYNDDIAFEDWDMWLERLATGINKGFGAIMPLQADSRNPHSIIMGGTFAAFPSGIHKMGTRSQHCRDEFEPAKWLPFCAVAFNPAALKHVGLLDEQMVMWFSDSDWCARARLMGFPVVLDRQTIILHDNHATVGPIERGSANGLRFVADQEAFRRKWSGEMLADMS